MTYQQKNWKKPNKGTRWTKFSRGQVNFKKLTAPLKKDDSLDGVYEYNPTTNETIYYTPQQWKSREIKLNQQTL